MYLRGYLAGLCILASTAGVARSAEDKNHAPTLPHVVVPPQHHPMPAFSAPSNSAPVVGSGDNAPRRVPETSSVEGVPYWYDYRYSRYLASFYAAEAWQRANSNPYQCDADGCWLSALQLDNIDLRGPEARSTRPMEHPTSGYQGQSYVTEHAIAPLVLHFDKRGHLVQKKNQHSHIQ